MFETTVKHVWSLWRATSLIPDLKQHVKRTRSFPKGFRTENIFSRSPDLHARLNHCKIKGIFLFYKKQTFNNKHIAWIAIANFVIDNQHVYAIYRKKKKSLQNPEQIEFIDVIAHPWAPPSGTFPFTTRGRAGLSWDTMPVPTFLWWRWHTSRISIPPNHYTAAMGPNSQRSNCAPLNLCRM